MPVDTHEEHLSPQWGRAKSIRQTKGLTAPQLMRYADEGLIRTSHVRRPGHTRGVRLFHLGDIDRLIQSGIEMHPDESEKIKPETK